MTARRRRALALAAVLTATAAATAAGQPAERESVFARRATPAARPLDPATWRRVDTAHFALLGDVPAATLRGLAADLEALATLLAGLNPAVSTPEPPRAAVIVFADDRAFSDYAPLSSTGEPVPVAGYFLSHPHGDFVVASAAGRDIGRVLYHEAIHHFVRHHLPEAPLWLNEGLAEFYSTLVVGRGEAWVGRPVVEHVVRLEGTPRRPLEQLLAVDETSHAYHDGDLKGAFYAEAWALVHYLLTADDGRAEIARYAGLLRAGEDADPAFVAVFGGASDLDRRVGEHLRQPPREPLRIRLRHPTSAADLTAHPVAEPELEHRMGWLLAHHVPPRAAAARTHFESALRAAPGYPGAVAGMGWLEEIAGDHDAARQLYAQAGADAPRDPLPPFLEALALARDAAALPDEDRGGNAAQKLYEAARAGFRRSLALEPNLAEAWAGLGAAWLADRSPQREGLEALREAYRRLPSRDDVLFNLTLYEARLGSAKRAQALYARLEQRADPEWVERARESLLRVELEHAERLLREGRAGDAIEIMTRVSIETGDPDLAAWLQSRLEQLERAQPAGGGGS